MFERCNVAAEFFTASVLTSRCATVRIGRPDANSSQYKNPVLGPHLPPHVRHQNRGRRSGGGAQTAAVPRGRPPSPPPFAHAAAADASPSFPRPPRLPRSSSEPAMAASRPLPLRLAVPLALALLLALVLVADFLRASSSSSRRVSALSSSARTVPAPRGPHCPDCLTRRPFSDEISWF